MRRPHRYVLAFALLLAACTTRREPAPTAFEGKAEWRLKSPRAAAAGAGGVARPNLKNAPPPPSLGPSGYAAAYTVARCAPEGERYCLDVVLYERDDAGELESAFLPTLSFARGEESSREIDDTASGRKIEAYFDPSGAAGKRLGTCHVLVTQNGEYVYRTQLAIVLAR